LQLTRRGVVIVAAAGNSSSDVANFSPANCPGVVAVAASTVDGDRASFSNFGAGVTITAPGDAIFSACGSNGQNDYKSGTSMAAPHVTAAIALARGANPALTGAQAVLALRAGARAFPSLSNCSTATCGVGLLDARATLDRAQPNASAVVGWASGAQSIRENDGSLTLSLTRLGATASAVSVDVAAIDGVAALGLDFDAPTPSRVSWAAGDATDKKVTIPVRYRSGEQGAREFSMSLTSATAATSIVAPSVLPIRITEVDCNTVVPIAVGDIANGDLGLSGNTYCRGGVRGPEYNTVRYRFTANAGDLVTIAVNSTTTTGILDPYVYLLDANFKVLTENDDIQNGV
ncbi:MAG: S8 family peptidase, partial [Casimicrobium sp.]